MKTAALDHPCALEPNFLKDMQYLSIKKRCGSCSITAVCYKVNMQWYWQADPCLLSTLFLILTFNLFSTPGLNHICWLFDFTVNRGGGNSIVFDIPTTTRLTILTSRHYFATVSQCSQSWCVVRRWAVSHHSYVDCLLTQFSLTH